MKKKRSFNKEVKIRLSDNQKIAAIELAGLYGFKSLSGFFRAIIEGEGKQPVLICPQKDLYDLIRALNFFNKNMTHLSTMFGIVEALSLRKAQEIYDVTGENLTLTVASLKNLPAIKQESIQTILQIKAIISSIKTGQLEKKLRR